MQHLLRLLADYFNSPELSIFCFYGLTESFFPLFFHGASMNFVQLIHITEGWTQTFSLSSWYLGNSDFQWQKYSTENFVRACKNTCVSCSCVHWYYEVYFLFNYQDFFFFRKTHCHLNQMYPWLKGQIVLPFCHVSSFWTSYAILEQH